MHLEVLLSKVTYSAFKVYTFNQFMNSSGIKPHDLANAALH